MNDDLDMLPKLKPKYKKLWLEALRSGRYKQGRDKLRTPVQDSYCCLGVLCDVVKTELGEDWDYDTFIREDSDLPEDVAL